MNEFQKLNVIDKLLVLKQNFELNKDKNVIFDRYHISEVVYSRTLRNIELDLNYVERVVFGENINLVMLVLIDLDARVAQKRIKARDGLYYKQNLIVERKMFSEFYKKSKIMNKILIYNKGRNIDEAIDKFFSK